MEQIAQPTSTSPDVPPRKLVRQLDFTASVYGGGSTTATLPVALDPSQSQWLPLRPPASLPMSLSSISSISVATRWTQCFIESDEAMIRMKRKKFWEKAVDRYELCGSGENWWGVQRYMRDNLNHSNKAISYEKHFQSSRFVESVLDVYWELPPVAGPSLTHQTRYDPARASDPIIEDGRFGLFQRLGLTKFETSVFNGYTQMVYLQVSPPTS
ncbi:hypothetical protein ZIOFF_004903 [Zingiber officinale]|uniref:Uncharacterized protein n=1 Tax=Zingiber officinale TaxID=94328 RepID=A0A8J5M164_ZINOF|nr:hypothetical protein ZIOFF_004903 [Zingiber officinale]